MDHFVKLDRLPAGVTFPPELGERIRYDSAQGRLYFRGFMSKADFDRLIVLHSDWGFRRALEDLFRLCTPEAAEGRRGLRWLRGVFGRLGL